MSQSHDHIAWIKSSYPEYKLHSHIILGPDGVVLTDANPDGMMVLVKPETFVLFQSQLIGIIEDIRANKLPLERPAEWADRKSKIWGNLESWFSKLQKQTLTSLKQ